MCLRRKTLLKMIQLLLIYIEMSRNEICSLKEFLINSVLLYFCIGLKT